MVATTLSAIWPKIEMNLPSWVSTVLTALVLITLARVIMGFFDNSSDTLVAVPTRTPENIRPQPRADYDRKIAQLHLMGQTATPLPVVVEVKEIEETPDTTLDLKLLGVMAGGKEYGYAIISSGGKKEKYYALGDLVLDNAILHSVFPDRVIFERDTRKETLRLPRADSQEFDKKLSLEKSAVSAAAGKKQPATDSFGSLNQFRKELMRNPARFTEYINIAPEGSESGGFMGYKLTPGKNTDVFYKLGLEPGDVVMMINDITLDAPNKGPKAMQSLVTADELTLVVNRAGTEITLSQNLSQ